jgi:hypothetical protein
VRAERLEERRVVEETVDGGQVVGHRQAGLGQNGLPEGDSRIGGAQHVGPFSLAPQGLGVIVPAFGSVREHPLAANALVTTLFQGDFFRGK